MSKIRPSDAIPLSELARHLTDRKTAATLYHWYRHGLLNKRTGEIFKLQTVRVGTGRGSTLLAIDELFDKLE